MINTKNLDSLPCVRPGFNGDSFVYMLINDDDVVYVGQSKDLKVRLGQHKYAGIKFNSVSYLKTKGWVDTNNAEAELIVRHSPARNKTLPSNDYFIPFGVAKESIMSITNHMVNSLDFVFDRANGRNNGRYINISDLDNLKSILSTIDLTKAHKKECK